MAAAGGGRAARARYRPGARRAPDRCRGPYGPEPPDGAPHPARAGGRKRGRAGPRPPSRTAGKAPRRGLARSAPFPIRAIAEPHLRHLSESLGDTTFLTIRNGVDSVCIDRRPGSFSVKGLSIEMGARGALGVGVSGLVLLASLQPEEAAEVVRRNARRLQALRIDPAELLERALRTRAQGYAYAPVGV